ncbi:hypothetical protein B0T26DRAFT_678051 [Lasiosphaeria miniovina]|uniref:Uncharacterized protein n=1 Tax=Lasiosphaeria miniovina TaxID=1954250 RepID=A0AA40ADD9_9PEZI|nr:uncharacterized protein B0T26DRAFT_678051 [Lasiosphaeria miniovina]KAK0713760.1 hypothetical protein B0T26DRAFT_678051 [Lasiosphaeria miniovina]
MTTQQNQDLDQDPDQDQYQHQYQHQYPYRQREEKVAMLAGFIDTKAPAFHAAFANPSALNTATMRYEPPEISDLRATLEQHHRVAAKYIDFTPDLNQCTWDDVHEELRKAQSRALENEKKRNPLRKAWRALGSTSSILAPGLDALPDELCVLHGALALIFSLARHSEMNRLKILAAFESVPNIIEMARNKAETFKLDSSNPKSIQLHKCVQELQLMLIRTLPALINRLVPGTFLNAWKSPFGTWKIDKLLDTVSGCAAAVRTCAEGLIEELIVGNYSASKTIQLQLDEVLRQQRTMQMSIDAAHGKTQLLHFLMEQLSFLPDNNRNLASDDRMSDLGTALPGYTAEELLKLMDVNHMRTSNDAIKVMRRGASLNQADIERAAHMAVAAQVRELLSTSNGCAPSIVAVDGHFDRSQMGKVSPLSYVCAMLAQALRQKQQQQQQQQPNATAAATSSSPSPSMPRSPDKPAPPSPAVVLEYYCALHATDGGDDDELRGPQGLLRCLTTQLLLALVDNGWIGAQDAVDLPHLCGSDEGDEQEQELQLVRRDVTAIGRLFAALIRLVPRTVPIYCLVDGWSAFERDPPPPLRPSGEGGMDGSGDDDDGSDKGDRLWRAGDYAATLDAFRDAADPGAPGGDEDEDDDYHYRAATNFRLLLTSPTASRWLGNFILPGQRVSLRNVREAGGGWQGAAAARKRRAMGLGRAATLPDVHRGGGLQLPVSPAYDEQGQVWSGDGHDRRSST